MHVICFMSCVGFGTQLELWQSGNWDLASLLVPYKQCLTKGSFTTTYPLTFEVVTMLLARDELYFICLAWFDSAYVMSFWHHYFVQVRKFCSFYFICL